MKAENKAKELVEKLFKEIAIKEVWSEPLLEFEAKISMTIAKQCAIKCCDEMITHSYSSDIVEHFDHSYEYWQQVKQAITQLP